MNNESLELLLRQVVVRSFKEGMPTLNVVVDDGMLFGAWSTVRTNNEKWRLYMEVKFQLVGGEDETLDNPEVVAALTFA